ncbi:unnamed protein product [Pleuronectes platessa]|uniref:Uncharacterized protein n=1 Tax=Pleuronectes platessa TaxID=8262 RepID=A0A9N7YLM4_PLEPL|nr:unnamed protein product [Pleuronectes platessa]
MAVGQNYAAPPSPCQCPNSRMSVRGLRELLATYYFRIPCNPTLLPQYLMSYQALAREALLSLFQPFQFGSCSGGHHGMTAISVSRARASQGVSCQSPTPSFPE